MCPCDTAPMDTAHGLQDCPLQDIPRLAAWPEESHPPPPPPPPPEGEAVHQQPSGPEEDDVVRASHWRGCLEEVIEEEEEVMMPLTNLCQNEIAREMRRGVEIIHTHFHAIHFSHYRNLRCSRQKRNDQCQPIPFSNHCAVITFT